MPTTQCPLCSRGDVKSSAIGTADVDRIECPVCGLFEMTREAQLLLIGGAYLPDDRVRLTWASRQANEAASKLRLMSDNIRSTADSVTEPSPPIRKVDELVLYVGRKAPVLNQPAPFNETYAWPLIRARDVNEMAAIRNVARDQLQLVTQDSQGFRLTLKGWERFAVLDSERPRSTNAFVAMWFSQAMQGVYDQGIQPALSDLGYDAIKVDRVESDQKIDDLIIASIRKSSLVVSDFTGMRTGVFFEAGFALGLGIPVIWTCRDTDVAKLGEHFDTRQYPHIVWKDAADLKKALRRRIEAVVVGRPKPRVEADN